MIANDPPTVRQKEAGGIYTGAPRANGADSCDVKSSGAEGTKPVPEGYQSDAAPTVTPLVVTMRDVGQPLTATGHAERNGTVKW